MKFGRLNVRWFGWCFMAFHFYRLVDAWWLDLGPVSVWLKSKEAPR